MKKLVGLLFILFISISFTTKVKALNVSENDITLSKGSNTTLSITDNFDKEISKIEFNFVYYSYDITGNFIVNSNYKINTSGVAHTIIFDEPVTVNITLGEVRINVLQNPNVKSSNINLNNIRLTTTDGTVINQDNLVITVKVDDNANIVQQKKEEPKEVKKNLLESIDSEIVQIELKEDVYEYTVNIDEDIKELDLKPVAKDKNTTIDISDQKIEDLEDNKITIKASLDNSNEEYIINVKVNKKVQIDSSKETKTDTSYKGKWLILIVVLSLGLVVSIMLAKKK